ncbi:MAG: threonine synthase [Candidatus Gracilibacteria bacterium]
MKFYSTAGKQKDVSLKYALLRGLSTDGGLFVPEKIPTLPAEFFDSLATISFHEIAFEIANKFFDEIPEHDLKEMVVHAFDFPVPLVSLTENLHILELFHGPTLAFKDFGARFLAQIISYFAKKEKKNILILVATSGDTGSAVAQGFHNLPNVQVALLYPSGKVSPMQEKQLTTIGGNVTALEIEGTFDDCQAMVKQAFIDSELNTKLTITSANSINIARLIPQSFYYFYAFAQLKNKNRPIAFSIPSGNFGNLTAGLIAKKMGLPIDRFIAATNANDSIPRYFATGRFTPRPSQKTISNAMDVGNPNNFARINNLYQGDLDSMKKDISAFSFSDAQTSATIKDVYEKFNYTLDPHGAVGYLGAKKYLVDHPDANTIVLETAHPAKFLDIVEPIIGAKILVPDRLKIALSKPKISTKLSNNFADFKHFLLDNFAKVF